MSLKGRIRPAVLAFPGVFGFFNCLVDKRLFIVGSSGALNKVLSRVLLLERNTEFLNWSVVYGLAHENFADKIAQIGAIEEIKHSIMTDPRVEDMIYEATQGACSSNISMHAVKYMKRLYNKYNSVPIRVLVAFNSVRASSMFSWASAKAQKSFDVVKDDFTELIKVKREVMAAKADFLGCSGYDAMIGQYEEGLSSKDLDDSFIDAGGFLKSYMDGYIAQPKVKTDNPLRKFKGKLNVNKQKDLWFLFAKLFGLDVNNINFVEFPCYSSFICDGLHIGFRSESVSNIYSMPNVLFQLGTHLFDRLNPLVDCENKEGLGPIGSVMSSMQGFIFSRLLLSSLDFLRFLAPKLSEILGVSSDLWTPDNIHNLFNSAFPNNNKEQSDVITYPIHLMLRYTLEKALLDGELPVADLPRAWNDDIKHYLGILPKHDAEGCLQDVHWYFGEFGKFPVLLFSFISGCCLFEHMLKTGLLDIDMLINGNLTGLLDWTEVNIYAPSFEYSAFSLLKKITGSAFDINNYSDFIVRQRMSG